MEETLYSPDSVFNHIIEYEKGVTILLSTHQPTKQLNEGDSYHITEEQDTLNDIAVKYYKDSKQWYRIALANDIINPFELEVGKQLVIPKIN